MVLSPLFGVIYMLILDDDGEEARVEAMKEYAAEEERQTEEITKKIDRGRKLGKGTKREKVE